jgi:hypothetical protein
MNQQEVEVSGNAGAFGVNYALRPHKFVDRRIFIEVIGRYGSYSSLKNHVYVGLGSFAMEDHKLVNATIGIDKLVSLEIDSDVLARQKFNNPLACIKPTRYSTADFVVKKRVILHEVGISEESNSIVWFDMTDRDPLRVQLDTFRRLLETSEVGDLIRMTVDVDERTLGRRADGEELDAIELRRFRVLREQLGDDLRPSARRRDIRGKLGIVRLVLYAFRLQAERAFQQNSEHQFLPLSTTTYADGHRMLSITGAIVRRAESGLCRERMELSRVSGGVQTWDEIVEVQIPQLTVWEKLALDRKLERTTRRMSDIFEFRLHETISTEELLRDYQKFQRFYPTFRHVLL